MGRRSYKRVRLALPVTISGLDANGNPFKQTATTVEIGVRGMRLRDVYCLRGRGDPVQVEYKHRRADYRVAWISEPEGLVGLEAIDDAHLLFAQHLPNEIHASPNPAADTYEPPAQVASTAGVRVAPIPIELPKTDRRQLERRQHERRRDRRFHCAGVAKIWEDGTEAAVTRRMNELSSGGCYIETMSPAPAGTSIRLELEVNGRTLHLQAVVRYSQPAYGMGLEFIDVLPPEAEKLDRVVAEISGEVPVQYPEPATPSPPAREPLSGEELAEAVQRWFGTHDVLNRAEFLRLVQEGE